MIALATICLLWAGMVLGISCLDGPIRFTAPSLKQAVAPELGRAIALDIGRVTFKAFSKVEIIWSLMTLVLLLGVRPFRRVPRAIAILFALVWPIVAFQSFVLIPALAIRAQMIMNKQVPSPAPYHMLYSSTEIIKLICLITLGVLLIKAVAAPEKSESV